MIYNFKLQSTYFHTLQPKEMKVHLTINWKLDGNDYLLHLTINWNKIEMIITFNN